MITVRRGDRGYVGQGSESMMGRCVIASLVVRVVAHFAGFSLRMLVTQVCANICRVDQKWAKCLKISENALPIQIFFVYLPDFSRVTLTCVYGPRAWI